MKISVPEVFFSTTFNIPISLKELFFPFITSVDYYDSTKELLTQARGGVFNFSLISFPFLEKLLLFPSVLFVDAAEIIIHANFLTFSQLAQAGLNWWVDGMVYHGCILSDQDHVS